MKMSYIVKYSANIITILRIMFSIVMVLVIPFSTMFWICYLYCGLSDFADGAVARKLNQQSAFGALLDSLADFIFGIAIAIVVIANVELPVWLWLYIFVIAMIKFIGYGIGFYKYHAFSSFHTYTNKVTGMLIFTFPILYKLFELNVAGILICTVALISSTEEVIITITSNKLYPECTSLLDL